MQVKLASDSATILWKDGDKRGSIVPTYDLAGYSQEIQDFAALVWTPELINKWRAEHYPEPTLEELKERKNTELREACRAHIFAGFDSDALGTVHRYPLSQTDQANNQKTEVSSMKNTDTVGWTGLMQCVDAEGVKKYRAHTATQVAQVTAEIDKQKNAALQKFEDLLKKVQAAETESDLSKIVW